jgi:hypothetical protein
MHLLLALVGVQERLYQWLTSHTEWVQKTTMTGGNWEIFWFDCGKEAA